MNATATARPSLATTAKPSLAGIISIVAAFVLGAFFGRYLQPTPREKTGANAVIANSFFDERRRNASWFLSA
jgi:hypothetical protein